MILNHSNAEKGQMSRVHGFLKVRERTAKLTCTCSAGASAGESAKVSFFFLACFALFAVKNDRSWSLPWTLRRSKCHKLENLFPFASLAVCRRAIFRGATCQFEPRRAPRTRGFKGFLSDLSVLRGKKKTPTRFSDSLLADRFPALFLSTVKLNTYV